MQIHINWKFNNKRKIIPHFVTEDLYHIPQNSECFAKGINLCWLMSSSRWIAGEVCKKRLNRYFMYYKRKHISRWWKLWEAYTRTNLYISQPDKKSYGWNSRSILDKLINLCLKVKIDRNLCHCTGVMHPHRKGGAG